MHTYNSGSCMFKNRKFLLIHSLTPLDFLSHVFQVIRPILEACLVDGSSSHTLTIASHYEQYYYTILAQLMAISVFHRGLLFHLFTFVLILLRCMRLCFFFFFTPYPINMFFY